jgi:Flp pilus assembly protein TadD
MALLGCLGMAATACTSLGVAPRPSTGPRAQPPASEQPAAQQRDDTTAPPARRESDASGASDALLTQSRNERAAGNYVQATASIERALRIDPNNAALWLELGELQLQTGNAAQATTMARKALTLASGNGALTTRAERLLRAAGAR